MAEVEDAAYDGARVAVCGAVVAAVLVASTGWTASSEVEPAFAFVESEDCGVDIGSCVGGAAGDFGLPVGVCFRVDGKPVFDLVAYAHLADGLCGLFGNKPVSKGWRDPQSDRYLVDTRP